MIDSHLLQLFISRDSLLHSKSINQFWAVQSDIVLFPFTSKILLVDSIAFKAQFRIISEIKFTKNLNTCIYHLQQKNIAE